MTAPALDRPAGSRRAGVGRTSPASAALPVGTTLALVGLWQVLALTGVLPSAVSSPVEIAGWLLGQVGGAELWTAVGHTLTHTVLGLLLGSAVGMALGLLMGEVPLLHHLLQSSVEFLRPIPAIVYLPLLILVLGAVGETAVLLVAVSVVWPMLYQTMYGVRAVDGLLVDASRLFGLGGRQRLLWLTLPSISPYLATGLRISLSLALVVSVGIELIAGVPGLGWSLTQYQTAANYPGVYGTVVVAGTLSLVLTRLVAGVERRVLRWHVSHRGSADDPRARRLGTSLLVPVVVAAAWWFLSDGSDSVFFPPLRSIVASFQETWLFAHLVSDVVPTLSRLFAGYGIAVVVGVVLGVVMGRVRVVDAALQPAVQFARAIPAVALIPVAILLLGIGDSAKILLIAFCCVFPILLNTIDGVRGVESGLEDVGRSFRLTHWQRVVTIQLPSAMPQVFAGMRTALGFAFILGIVAEMTGSTNGVGFITLEAQQTFDISQMWSGMILLGVLGSVLNALFLLVERRVLRWHHRSQAGV